MPTPAVSRLVRLLELEEDEEEEEDGTPRERFIAL
jgi:hypothetical protein